MVELVSKNDFALYNDQIKTRKLIKIFTYV